jgi:hypothetical protein
MSSPQSRKVSRPVPGKLDPGIRKAVELLQRHDVETYESCEGGPGHAFTEPTSLPCGSTAIPAPDGAALTGKPPPP